MKLYITDIIGKSAPIWYIPSNNAWTNAIKVSRYKNMIYTVYENVASPIFTRVDTYISAVNATCEGIIYEINKQRFI